MPEYEDRYNELILEARRQYLRELRPSIIEGLYLEYAHTIDNIIGEFGEGQITRARAEGLIASIQQHVERLGGRLADVVDNGVLDAAGLAAEGHQQGIVAARQVAGTSVSYNFAAVPERAIEQMFIRRGMGFSVRFKTLIDRHIEEMAPEVDRFIQSSVAQGRSAPETAEKMARIMARQDPAVKEALDQISINPKTREITQRISQTVDDIPEDQLNKASRLLFDNYRIAVTETNNAYFEADRVASNQSPVVDLVKWEVSGRHFGLASSPDVCTIYFQRDIHGYGPGLYHTASCPALPHPFCGCSTSKKLLRPSQWGRGPRDLPQPKEVGTGEVRDTMETAAEKVRQRGGSPRTITQKHIERQVEEANRGISQAHEVAQELQTAA